MILGLPFKIYLHWYSWDSVNKLIPADGPWIAVAYLAALPSVLLSASVGQSTALLWRGWEGWDGELPLSSLLEGVPQKGYLRTNVLQCFEKHLFLSLN